MQYSSLMQQSIKKHKLPVSSKKLQDFHYKNLKKCLLKRQIDLESLLKIENLFVALEEENRKKSQILCTTFLFEEFSLIAKKLTQFENFF
jgi:hypothetical protein